MTRFWVLMSAAAACTVFGWVSVIVLLSGKDTTTWTPVKVVFGWLGPIALVVALVLMVLAAVSGFRETRKEKV